MIVPDVNLLVYAYNSDSPFHRKALAWWEECLSGAESVGLPLVVIFGFVRVTTNPRVFKEPLTAAEAAEHVRSWLSQSVVQVLQPSETHVEEVLASLEKLGTAGNLVTDAQIARLAIEHRAILHTADADFLRFGNLQWRNPITGDASAKRERT